MRPASIQLFYRAKYWQNMQEKLNNKSICDQWMCTLLVVLFHKLYVLEGINSLGARYIFMIGPWNTVTPLII
jgi:hypothetical protein